MRGMPKSGTLERAMLLALIAHPEGVTFFDLEGTGITEECIDTVAENLRNGIYESEDDDLLKVDA